jgi:hypothetical protein
MSGPPSLDQPRWLRDLRRFLPLKSQFVLSGNVRDLQILTPTVPRSTSPRAANIESSRLPSRESQPDRARNPACIARAIVASGSGSGCSSNDTQSASSATIHPPSAPPPRSDRAPARVRRDARARRAHGSDRTRRRERVVHDVEPAHFRPAAPPGAADPHPPLTSPPHPRPNTNNVRSIRPTLDG